ncbi:MAG: S8 family peptidase, partial [Nocardioidaceae bacterium]|nr:S8 family peptidase [Nocardioidaceae bacterium]
MSHAPVRARVRNRLVVSTLALGVFAAGLGATATSGAATDMPSQAPAAPAGNYIVLLDAAPAVAYDGGIAGYRATAPAAGDRFDADTRAAERYVNLLEDHQDAVAATVDAEPFYHYTASLNGFAAELSAADVRRLEARRDVTAVVRDEKRELDTVNTPRFLGLSGVLGLWRRLGGPDSSNGAGKGVVVGIVDSGIDSDSKSFGQVSSEPPESWTGTCDTGDGSYSCNNKLIGGHYYTAGQGGDDAIWEGEYLSPEDFGGHGTHTASTAAGKSGVDVNVEGIDFGTASGMAPAAKVSSYKVCWSASESTSDGCFSSDSAAAIDQAVTDGVDVINYSISGSLTTTIDIVEVAFMYAADGGVFVAASAGNSGPGASTVAHPSPWITTVAATTHTRDESTLVLGNGEEYVGASVTDGIEDTPMVLAVDAAAVGADPEDAQLCLPGTLDPAAVAGNMVVCDRGVNARAEKSLVVRDAGGVAMVLVNVTPSSLNGDLHYVPSVHLQDTDRPDIYSYVETAEEPTGAILAGQGDGSTAAPPPAIAAFSSRGPSLSADGDLLKPDIAAPGVDVLAAVAPEGNNGRNFDFYSGTSMSSPHIAGLAALVAQKHPRWSPMMIKSAMMTTASNLSDGRDPFAQGAGFVEPNSFMDPGLVFDSDFSDWEDFLTGQGLPLSDNPVAASNFNGPSVAINDLAGRETVTRRVTNVDDKAATYRLTRSVGLPGIRFSMSPETFRLRPGRSRDIELTFTRGPKAPYDDYSKGYLALKGDRGHTVRFPVVVNPAQIAAPAEVSSSQDTFTFRAKSGVSGTIKAGRNGLVAGNEKDRTATNTNAAGFDPDDPRNHRQNVFIGGPAATLRVEL